MAASAAGRYNLAMCLLQAKGVETDEAAAVALFELAAEQGYARAQLNPGRALAEGRGVDRDPTAAVHWYRCAADRGYAKAQFTLASLYRRGLGVEKDTAQALAWLEKSARAGYTKAQYQLGKLLSKAAENPADETAARRWLEAAASAGGIPRHSTGWPVASSSWLSPNPNAPRIAGSNTEPATAIYPRPTASECVMSRGGARTKTPFRRIGGSGARLRRDTTVQRGRSKNSKENSIPPRLRGRAIQTPGPRGNTGANRVDGGLAASGSSSGSFSSQRSTS